MELHTRLVADVDADHVMSSSCNWVYRPVMVSATASTPTDGPPAPGGPYVVRSGRMAPEKGAALGRLGQIQHEPLVGVVLGQPQGVGVAEVRAGGAAQHRPMRGEFRTPRLGSGGP